MVLMPRLRVWFGSAKTVSNGRWYHRQQHYDDNAAVDKRHPRRQSPPPNLSAERRHPPPERISRRPRRVIQSMQHRPAAPILAIPLFGSEGVFRSPLLGRVGGAVERRQEAEIVDRLGGGEEGVEIFDTFGCGEEWGVERVQVEGEGALGADGVATVEGMVD